MAARMLGKYAVTLSLKSSGLVEVFEARDPQLDRHVLIKLLHPPADAGPDFEQRFRSQIKAVAALRDPHIVQILDFAVADGLPFVVTEYLEGGTLADRLAEYRRATRRCRCRGRSHLGVPCRRPGRRAPAGHRARCPVAGQYPLYSPQPTGADRFWHGSHPRDRAPWRTPSQWAARLPTSRRSRRAAKPLEARAAMAIRWGRSSTSSWPAVRPSPGIRRPRSC